ncbi:MAG: hypothetical protein BJ554DRAFT_230 [Olpidium bornovanus]|uniref:Uncharacterized protein n=1 Tax=Olpidium bornovanus TaxID=278681 RepID=A0A8H7ZTS7_9FUNG|nr:MAG: hypothetical protein BJ554DRAFT_230 [Olpidium bornovanus]
MAAPFFRVRPIWPRRRRRGCSRWPPSRGGFFGPSSAARKPAEAAAIWEATAADARSPAQVLPAATWRPRRRGLPAPERDRCRRRRTRRRFRRARTAPAARRASGAGNLPSWSAPPPPRELSGLPPTPPAARARRAPSSRPLPTAASAEASGIPLPRISTAPRRGRRSGFRAATTGPSGARPAPPTLFAGVYLCSAAWCGRCSGSCNPRRRACGSAGTFPPVPRPHPRPGTPRALSPAHSRQPARILRARGFAAAAAAAATAAGAST